jgi:hypothetical protein
MSAPASARVAIQARTLLALGPLDIARVMAYRAALRLGIHPAQRLPAPSSAHAPFLNQHGATRDEQAPAAWGRAWRAFGCEIPAGLSAGCPPDWLSPLGAPSIARSDGPLEPWWKIPDFDAGVGDIKNVWEFSRFDWVVSMAQRAGAGRADELARANEWLSDWLSDNPPYRGPNWKCGQEASIRVLHLALAAMILGSHRSLTEGMKSLVELHLRRIRPTMSYAEAQRNNHATSEAAAMFIGGSWLASASGTAEHRAWEQEGRRALERNVSKLFLPDGSFSQASLNYHRLALDTLALAERWRTLLDRGDWSDAFRARAIAATRWLEAMVDPSSGDAPNLGANDGALLMDLADAGYRDYRPSVRAASILFEGVGRFAGVDTAELHCRWLGVHSPSREAPASHGLMEFHDGGYMRFRSGNVCLLFRRPVYPFRPCHCDALHVDLWIGSRNIVRDGGSFSYAAVEPWASYFPGTASHSTVQFDSRDQMPRLGRFLFGEWLRPDEPGRSTFEAAELSASGSYRDWRGACHRRELSLKHGLLRTRDLVSGFTKQAKLRWRLEPGEWSIQGSSILRDDLRVDITCNGADHKVRLVEGMESRYYGTATPIPVVECTVDRPCTITTMIAWKQ